MAQSQKNMREIIVQTGGIATETTLKAFVASATSGEIGVLPKGGETAAYGVPFVIARKTADGLIASDVIDPKTVTRLELVDYVAPVQRAITASSFPVPATAGEKYEYQVSLRVYNWGSLSPEDYKIFHGQTVLTQTSAPLTAEAAVDGLVTNLNLNLSKENGATSTSNPLFSFAKSASSQTVTVGTAPSVSANATVVLNGANVTVALLSTDTADGAATKIAAAIDAVSGFTASAAAAVVTATSDSGDLFTLSYNAGTTGSAATVAVVGASSGLSIVSKEQPAILGKSEGRDLQFDVTVKVNKVGDEYGTYGIVQPIVTVTAPGNPGMGSGKEISKLEYFYRGNRGDVMRGMHFPFNWSTSTKTLSDPAGTYDVIELEHYEKSDGINVVNLHKSVFIAVPVAQDAAAVLAAIQVYTVQP